jgi:crotonobetainyl-CoA:carnitine CoA-transferase CaiB-like acyl-CoA transferase
MDQAPGILDGIRVLDFGQVLAAPTTTRLMAELGAEVIKVELAPNGDSSRLLPFQKNGRSGYFIQQNRGKRSLCIDRRDERAIALLKRLVTKVDVMVENFAPGVIDRMGLGWDVVHALNPRLIMASISAFGEGGALSALPGYDYIAASYAGVLDMIGEPDGAPCFPMLGMGDVMTGVHAMAAVNAALFYRERTGKGQRVATSLLEAYFHCHEINVQAYTASRGEVQPRRNGSHHYAGCPCGIYPVGDGYLFIVVLSPQWAAFCQAMGRPELIDDPRFATPGARVENSAPLIEIIKAYLTRYGSATGAAGARGRARTPAAPILSVAQAANHPHLIETGIVREVDDPVFGAFRIPGMPLHFSEQPDVLPLQAEYLGQSNAAVMRELLGLSDGEIRTLEADGVLVSRPDA